uniref:Uncharacterized protein n=1 Tax=Oryza brachyantha TaxID=4533 RepID=J3N6S9_ORYBR
MMQSVLCHRALIFYITRVAGPEERLILSIESSIVALVIPCFLVFETEGAFVLTSICPGFIS